MYNDEMKNIKRHTAGKFQNPIEKSNKEAQLIPLAHIHYCSVFKLGTGGVKLAIWTKTSCSW